MKKKYVINQEDVQKVQAKMKEVKDVKSYKKLKIIALSGEGLTDAAIAKKKDSNIEFVRNVRKQFCLLGIDKFLSDGRKGGNHTIFSPEAEKEFLEEFTQKSLKGQIITVNEIAENLDQKTGKNRKSKSTAYKLLHRNGYRKIMPRPEHPQKATEEEIDSSKKLKQF